MEIDFPQDVETALSFIEERDRPAYIRNAVKMQLARDGRLALNAGGTPNSQGAASADSNPAIAILQRIATVKKVAFNEVLDEFNQAKVDDLESSSLEIARGMYQRLIG